MSVKIWHLIVTVTFDMYITCLFKRRNSFMYPSLYWIITFNCDMNLEWLMQRQSRSISCKNLQYYTNSVFKQFFIQLTFRIIYIKHFSLKKNHGHNDDDIHINTLIHMYTVMTFLRTWLFSIKCQVYSPNKLNSFCIIKKM